MSTTKRWFEVCEKGLAQVTQQRSPDWLLWELLQNAWDCPGVTTVSVTITPTTSRAARLVVTDDGEGFEDLSHAWTLYQETGKRGDDTKRGRFNLGEKLAFVRARSGEVITTTGRVTFGPDGRKVSRRVKRERGTQVTMELPWGKADIAAVLDASKRCIPPTGIATIVNGLPIVAAPAVASGRGIIETVRSGEGGLVKGYGYAPLTLHQPHDQPWLLERGVPICALPDDRWSVNVDARIPLGMDRSGVPPTWLRDLRAIVLNVAAPLLTKDEAADGWVSDALGDASTSVEATCAIVRHRFGEKAVIYDPSDTEASTRAASEGYVVVHGGSLPALAWERIRSAGILLPAGKVFPTPRVGASPDGTPPLAEEALTPRMREVADYARRLSEALIGRACEVNFFPMGATFHAEAWWGSGSLGLNSDQFRENEDERYWDALLLHEFAHEAVEDHMSERFHDEICRLGAALRGVNVNLARAPVDAPPELLWF